MSSFSYAGSYLNMKKIALIHTTPFVMEPIQKALIPFRENYHFYHMLDEAVLIRMMEDGNTAELTVPWLTALVDNTLKGGAEGVIVSCSSLSPAVQVVSEKFQQPVIRIDEALYRHVLKNCESPAVLMTNPTNEGPARLITDEIKESCGLDSDIPFVVCRGAFEALQRGDRVEHDREVVERIEDLMINHDGIILSQISIERVRAKLSEELRCKVHSSLDFMDETIRLMNI